MDTTCKFYNDEFCTLRDGKECIKTNCILWEVKIEKNVLVKRKKEVKKRRDENKKKTAQKI